MKWVHRKVSVFFARQIEKTLKQHMSWTYAAYDLKKGRFLIYLKKNV